MMRRSRRNKSLTGGSSSIKCIINVSSLLAFKGGIGAATYASTKAGVVALTRAIAAEGSLPNSGSRLRANVIVPGYIDTRMLDGMTPFFHTRKRTFFLLSFFSFFVIISMIYTAAVNSLFRCSF